MSGHLSLRHNRAEYCHEPPEATDYIVAGCLRLMSHGFSNASPRLQESLTESNSVKSSSFMQTIFDLLDQTLSF